MTAALIFLVTQSWRNATLSKLRRLRQPRYAIVTVVGLLYFGQMFLQSGRGWQMMGITSEVVQVVGPLMLLLMVTRPWWWPGGGRGGLGFSLADVHVLFPAPLRRRQLVAYRILQSQGALAAGALFFTVVTQAPLDATFVFRFVGVWCITGIVTTHAMAVTIARTGVVSGDTSSQVRRWGPAMALLLSIGIVAATVVGEWASLTALPDAAGRIEYLGVVLSQGAAGVVMWPFRSLFEVPTAGGAGAFAAALPPALVIWGVIIVWVLRTDAAFEETAADQAEKVAIALTRKTMVIAPKKGRRTLFALTPSGRPEIAFLWKNLIAAGQMSKFYLFFIFVWTVPVVIGFLATEGTQEVSGLIAILCLGIAAMTTMTGAMQVNFDLRQDLASLALIKSWPVSGATIVRGEVLAPALTLSGFTAFLIAFGTAIGSRTAVAQFGVTHLTLIQWALAAICLTTGIIAMQVLLQNGIAVMFPAWVRIGPKAAAGMEAMGQQLVMMLATFVLLPILAIPAVAIGAVVWVALSWSMGEVPVLIPAAVTAAGLLIESALGIEMVGRILDRTDISAVGP